MKLLTVPATTKADGTFSAKRRITGIVRAIFVEIGDLSTPDVTITADAPAKDILNVDGVAADTQYRIGEELVTAAGAAFDLDAGAATTRGVAEGIAVFGFVTFALAGAGNAKTGLIKVLYD